MTTQAIRTGANRVVLERILETGRIHTAWPNEPPSPRMFQHQDETFHAPAPSGQGESA